MDETNTRLNLSRETLYKWRAMGGPSGPIEGLLRMVGEELAVLEGLAHQHPDLSESITVLLDGYNGLQRELKAKAN